MADMKKLVIDGVEYEIIDESVRARMTNAESDISDLQSGKADAEDIPSNVSDLTNDTGFITEVPVEDVTVDGTSVLSGTTAAIPRATDTRAGVVKIDPSTETGTQYLDIYAEKENDAEKTNRVPLLNANNKILADQLPAATTSTQGAMSATDKTKLDGLLEAVYQVGAIYMSVIDTSPAELFGFGTWERWGSGRVPVGVDTSISAFNAVGKTGGNMDAVVPYHNHTFTGTALGTHTHTFTGTALGTHNHTGPSHTHTGPSHTHSGGTLTGINITKTSAEVLKTSAGTTVSALTGVLASIKGYNNTGAAGTGATGAAGTGNTSAVSAGTPAGTNASVSAGTPSGTISYAGTSGNVTDANLQPYITCYMWVRTA